MKRNIYFQMRFRSKGKQCDTIPLRELDFLLNKIAHAQTIIQIMHGRTQIKANGIVVTNKGLNGRNICLLL
jgi:hypothetical protein